MTTVRVREVQDRDAREVVALLSELGYPTDEAAAGERLRAKHVHVLVADEGGLVVGLATLATSAHADPRPADRPPDRARREQHPLAPGGCPSARRREPGAG